MANHSRNKGNKDQLEKNSVAENYKKAFGYGENGGDSGGPMLIGGANFDGVNGVYFDCYKYGKNDKNAKLRMFYDRNGDGEYSGKSELIGLSKKLDKKCAKYCDDFEKGSLKMRYDLERVYAKGGYEKRLFKEAYKDGEDGYGYTKATKRVKKYDEYGDKYYENKVYKKWYKDEIDCVKIDLKAYYYKKVVNEYDDYGYGGDGGDGYDYKKKDCETFFKVGKEKYLDNLVDALG